MNQTITDKIFQAHLRDEPFPGTKVLSIDRVLCHEITTPIAIADLVWRKKDRVFDAAKIKAVIDHVTPAKDSATAEQGKVLRDWAHRHGVEFFDIGCNGVCHAIFPEKGLIRPGYTVVMGDSHTCTHGAFGARDSLIGSLYLVISEVLEPQELGATFLLKSHQALMTVKNAGLSQPYYCRHDYIHLKRGEVKPFLKTYYNQFTALQDRETYTFWEHYFHASQHKTHEEGWFLMQTRWMLFLEEGKALSFLKAAPRRWLEHGKRIELKYVATYFGPASLTVESKLAQGVIEAAVACQGTRKPAEVRIRLPHPDGRKAVAVTGGRYDPATETVRITPFRGTARIRLRF